MDLDDREERIVELLNPIEGASPAGVDLRLDISPASFYFRLRDDRSEARAAERAVDNDPEAEAATIPEWSTVEALAREALATRSKDVEIACWLTEALTRASGLAGLAAGAALLAGLVDRFWDFGLFPAPDPDDLEGRLVAITGMSGQDRDGTLLQPLRKTVLWIRADGTPVPLWAFERAREIASLGGPEKKAAVTKALPFDELEAEARGMGRLSLLQVGRGTAMAQDAWRALEGVVGRASDGGPSPSTGRVRDALDRLRRIVETYIPIEEIAPPANAVPDGAAESDGAAEPDEAPREAVATPLQPSPIETREGLLEELLRIAAVFRRDEPNSPLSFTLEEAVRRARLAWPDLLRELISDDGARAAVLTVAGVKPPPE